MLQNLKLFLPALIPSWRFFDVIAPSPRIEFTLLKSPGDATGDWHEIRPRPANLSLNGMLRHLFFNPRWNESLFLVSCAERLTQHYTEHSRQEIVNRIRAELKQSSADVAASPWLQFRLAFVSRGGEEVQKHVTYVSPVYPSSGRGDS